MFLLTKYPKIILVLTAALFSAVNFVGLYIIIQKRSFILFDFLIIMAVLAGGVSLASIIFFENFQKIFGKLLAIIFFLFMAVLSIINLYWWIQANLTV